MAKSNKPLVWGLFAAGGTLTAFVTPVLVYLTLMAAYGDPPAALAYDNIHGFAANWLGKIALFVVISLSLWFAAHRLRTALHGLGLRADTAIAVAGYGISAIGTIMAAYYLVQI